MSSIVGEDTFPLLNLTEDEPLASVLLAENASQSDTGMTSLYYTARSNGFFNTDELLHNELSEQLILSEKEPFQVKCEPDEMIYTVENIQSHRINNGSIEYLVDWTGYNECTWEPAGCFESGVCIEQYFNRILSEQIRNLAISVADNTD